MSAAYFVDVKRRFINNTPSDVFRLLSHLRVTQDRFVDLRFEDRFPDADEAFLFLETAGTWMCFDWNEERFIRRIESLSARYRRVTVIGPQAAALRALTGEELTAITNVDFGGQLSPDYATDVAIDLAWMNRAETDLYNGEKTTSAGLSIRPTVSIQRSMSCPLACEFCYYGARQRGATVPWPRLLADLDALHRQGRTHCYFMDPNFVLRSEDWRRLIDFKKAHPEWTYYCQLSPNFLDDRVVEQLALSGCCGMVIGIENDRLIEFKSSLRAAQAAVERVRDAGMMPMLYFIVDGVTDTVAEVREFAGYPFRFSLLNGAFASDLSLSSIRRGFAEKEALRARCADMIETLKQSADYLGNDGARFASPCEDSHG